MQLKTVDDFPELKKYYTFSNYISKNHFINGLDPNCLMETDNHFSYSPVTREYINTPNKKTSILSFTLYGAIKDEELYNYTLELLLKVSQEKTLEQKYLDQIAFKIVSGHPKRKDILTYMVKNKIIDINVVDELGYNLLMYVEKKDNINDLINLGCDINHRVNNKNSKYYDKNYYEIAIKLRKKTLINNLFHYISQKDIAEANIKLLEKFKATNKTSSQFSLYKLALKENNEELIDLIVQHPKEYKSLISYYDKNQCDILNYAIKYNCKNVVSKIIDVDYFKSKKGVKDYVNYALVQEQQKLAQFLYDNGFYDEKSLTKDLDEGKITGKGIVNSLSKNGYMFSLETMYNNEANEGIVNKEYKIQEIDSFFKNHHYLLKMNNICRHGHRIYIYPDINVRQNVARMTLGKIKVCSQILALQEKIDFQSFTHNLEKLLINLGENDNDDVIKFAAVFLNDFPEKKNEILDYLNVKGKKEWISQLLTADFSKLLEEKEEKPVKRNKI